MEIGLGRLAFVIVLAVSVTPLIALRLAPPVQAFAAVGAALPTLTQQRIDGPDCRAPRGVRWALPSRLGRWGVDFMATLPAFLVAQTLTTLALLAAACGLGALVTRREWSPHLVRKMLMGALLVAPLAVARQLCPAPNLLHALASFALLSLCLGLFALPAVSQAPLLRTAFAALVRPEDGQNALMSLVTGHLAGSLLLILMVWWAVPHYPAYVFVAVSSVTVGDFLAGAVGRNLGRFSYRTPALLSRQNYTRTLEGSACVAATAALCLVAVRPDLPPQQFWLALALMPAALALAEAKAPHRWDEPAMFAAAIATSLAVVRLASGC